MHKQSTKNIIVNPPATLARSDCGQVLCLDGKIEIPMIFISK
jgi:hypothetical protein